MTWQDPIVEEVHKIREQLAAKHHYDVKALCQHLQEQEKQSQRHYVTCPPRPLDTPAKLPS